MSDVRWLLHNDVLDVCQLTQSLHLNAHTGGSPEALHSEESKDFIHPLKAVSFLVGKKARERERDR